MKASRFPREEERGGEKRRGEKFFVGVSRSTEIIEKARHPKAVEAASHECFEVIWRGGEGGAERGEVGRWCKS